MGAWPLSTWQKAQARVQTDPINKKVEGFYVLITFEGEMEGAAIAEAERTLRLDEKIMRVMVTRIPTIKAPKAKKVKEGANRNAEPQSAGQAGAQPQGR